MTDLTHLRDLIDLAKEPSSDRRRELLRGVTDLFLEDPGSYTNLESTHFSDIMGTVARSLEAHVRADLSRRLATVAEAPRDLVTQLANDEISVATPILESSLALTEEDLLDIIRQCSNAHRTAVAGRPDVNETISDALVDHGDDEVVKALIQNESAQIGQKTIAKVVDRAAKNEQLQEPLIDRQDLPPDVLHDMFWVVSTKLRSRILERSADLDPEIVDRVLAQTERKIMKDANRRTEERSRAQQFIDRKVELRELSETLLVNLIRAKRVPELICGFARLAKIDDETAERILRDPSGEGLAIACKATRLDRQTFSTLALLGAQKKKRTVEATRDLLDIYDQIPQDMAQRAMRFWRVRRDAESVAA
jgi:uncharacterized protein (DUF2336 family)